MARRGFSYSRWDGTQRGFDLDADSLLEEMADDLTYHGDLNAALRRMLQQGFRDRNGEELMGLREMLERLKQRRREEVESKDLGGPFAEIAERLREILDEERAGIERRLEEARAGDDQRRKEIVEDLATDGGSKKDFVQALRDARAASVLLDTCVANPEGALAGARVPIDPATGRRNVGSRRLSLRNRTQCGTNVTAPSDLKRIYTACVARGEKLPITFTCGTHPLDFVAATMRAPGDELSLVATMRPIQIPCASKSVLKCLRYSHSDTWVAASALSNKNGKLRPWAAGNNRGSQAE